MGDVLLLLLGIIVGFLFNLGVVMLVFILAGISFTPLQAVIVLVLLGLYGYVIDGFGKGDKK
ncbi:hypothetical protein [Clostridium felsineum]|uniref:hypothetical protein n=1 Tax=Clostridium felsineum TaxID=36839 RepID=UPI00098CE2EA|nr:hypothetical protein [Clostridium felsineum]URZ16910.1 hypothetical protein CLFE_029570 [Clostridium felsineum DSM 794]